MRNAALLLPLCLIVAAGCGSTPVKGEPDALLIEGKKLFQEKNYRQAQRRFRGITKYWEDSDEAEEGLFLEAECKRLRQEGTSAFDTYKSLVKRYPNSRYSVRVAQGEYELGLAHFDGKIKGFLFFKADQGYGVEVLEHMQLNFRNSSLADDALVHVVTYQMKEKSYEDAAATLERLLAEYPRSEHMLWGRFQLARALWLINQGPLYDARLLDRSRRAFEDYIGTAKLLGQAERQADQIRDAEEMIARIDARRAEKEYLIGRFYERTGYPASAAYYYRHCIRTFPGTGSAGECTKRLAELEDVLVRIEKEKAEAKRQAVERIAKQS